MTHASFFKKLYWISLVLSAPDRCFERIFEAFAFRRRQKSADDPSLVTMREFQFTWTSLGKFQSDARECGGQARRSHRLSRLLMEEINLLCRHPNTRFLFQLAEAVSGGQPNDQSIKAKETNHRERAHRDKGKARDKTHPRNDRHDQGKRPRAKRAVRRQYRVEINGLVGWLHDPSYRPNSIKNDKRGFASQESDVQPAASGLGDGS